MRTEASPAPQQKPAAALRNGPFHALPLHGLLNYAHTKAPWDSDC